MIKLRRFELTYFGKTALSTVFSAFLRRMEGTLRTGLALESEPAARRPGIREHFYRIFRRFYPVAALQKSATVLLLCWVISSRCAGWGQKGDGTPQYPPVAQGALMHTSERNYVRKHGFSRSGGVGREQPFCR